MGGESRDFGPYRLIRRLGVGGMAETFEAARLGEGGFEQRVCLKRVLPAYGDDPDFVVRFQREAKLAAKLRHSNIVGVIDAGEVDGMHYMALELVDGVDLRSLLRSSPDGRLDPETVIAIAIDLAHALEHAHQSLVHRDVSPSNILLGRSGDAKLADFGIAKAIEHADVTASKSANGKIPYMAPERMRGELVDARADMFSLGVVLFEALSGQRPFDGAHDVETMQRILADQRLRLEDIAPDVPERLVEVIDALIAVDREARAPSAAALLDALADLTPAPAVRRALATRIETLCGGPGTRLHVSDQAEERDTELTAPPKAVVPPLPARPAPRRRGWPFAALLALLAIGTAIATYEPPPPRQADTTTDTTTDTDTGTRAGTNTGASSDTGAGTDTDTAAETTPQPNAKPETPQTPTPPSRGWLNVIVEPWGNVWIDGKYFGRAPVKARLRGGRHVVEAGRDIPSRKQVVRVRPGAHREVTLALSED